MKLSGVVWLPEIVEKIDRKHGVAVEEVEEALANRPRFRKLERGRIDGEDVYAAYSRTHEGRYLTIILIRKLDRRALIVTARDMDRKERRQYGS
ncbi:MAG: BrnT family toxin [Thermoanaerobaculia bacterium]|nr:BrnT family toxin [Thermoanaerobaculia bacterium]